MKQRERQAKIPVIGSKVDVVLIALQLFLIARIGFRAVSRVLGVLGKYFGLTKAPRPQTIINWIARLSITRIQHMTHLVGSRVGGDPFSNGFLMQRRFWSVKKSLKPRDLVTKPAKNAKLSSKRSHNLRLYVSDSRSGAKNI